MQVLWLSYEHNQMVHMCGISQTVSESVDKHGVGGRYSYPRLV